MTKNHSSFLLNIGILMRNSVRTLPIALKTKNPPTVIGGLICIVKLGSTTFAIYPIVMFASKGKTLVSTWLWSLASVFTTWSPYTWGRKLWLIIRTAHRSLQPSWIRWGTSHGIGIKMKIIWSRGKSSNTHRQKNRPFLGIMPKIYG